MRVKNFIIDAKKFKTTAAEGLEEVKIDFDVGGKGSSEQFAFFSLADGKKTPTRIIKTIKGLKSKFTFVSGVHDRTRNFFGKYMVEGDHFGASIAARGSILVVGKSGNYGRQLAGTMTSAHNGDQHGGYGSSNSIGWGGFSVFSASAGKAGSLTNPPGFVLTGTIRSNIDNQVPYGVVPHRRNRTGCSVAISSDFTILVGAENETVTHADGNTNQYRGAAYVFNSSSIGPQLPTTVTFTAVFGSGEVSDVLRISDGTTTIDYTCAETGGSDAGSATQIGIGSDRAANLVVDEFVSKINASALNITAADNGGSSTNSSFTLTPGTGVTITITEDPANANGGNFGHTADHTAISGGTFSAGGWTQTQRITSSDTYVGESSRTDFFGHAVAIDGEHMLISAPYRWGHSGSVRASNNTAIGAVFAFRRTGAVGTATWTQTQLINDPGGANDHRGRNYDYFGWSLALSGTTAVIGQYSKNTFGYNDVGAAYVYDYSGGSWSLTQALSSSDMQAVAAGTKSASSVAERQFGWDVALDGNNILVSAPKEPSLTLTSSRGPYILYGTNLSSSHGVANGQNGTWYPLFNTEEDAVRWDKTALGGRNVGNKPLQFQFDVTSGRTYYMPSGSWIKLGASSSAGISPANHTTGGMGGGTRDFDYAAYTVSGQYLRINATGTLSPSSTYPSPRSGTGLYNGAVHVFEKNASNTWVNVAKLQDNDPDGESDGRYGYSVSINKNWVLIGAPKQSFSGSGGTHAVGGAWPGGMAYLYYSSSVNGWVRYEDRGDGLVNALTSSMSIRHVYDSDQKQPIFGYSTALTDDFAFVGDPHACTGSGPTAGVSHNDEPAGNVSVYYVDSSTRLVRDTSRAARGDASAGYNVASKGVELNGDKLFVTGALSSNVGGKEDGLWSDVTLIGGSLYKG